MYAKRNLPTVWGRDFTRANEMIRLFRDFFREEPFWSNKPLFPHLPLEKELSLIDFVEPLTDVCETKQEVMVRMEIPGVEKEDIQIHASSGGIEIKAEKKDEIKEEDKKKGRYRVERSYAGFYRFFSLPDNAEADKIEANYKNGILELRIPKTEQEIKKGKEIKVK